MPWQRCSGCTQAPNIGSNSIFFTETGKSLGGEFLMYWKAHGGVDLQGLPLTDQFEHISDLDGQIHIVQYFERAVYEYWPESSIFHRA